MTEELKRNRRLILEERINNKLSEVEDLRDELKELWKDDEICKKSIEFYNQLKETIVINNGVCIIKRYIDLDIFNEKFEYEKCDVNYIIIIERRGKLYIKSIILTHQLVGGGIEYQISNHGTNWEFSKEDLHQSFEYKDYQMWHIVPLNEFKKAIDDIIEWERAKWNKVYNEIKELYPKNNPSNEDDNANP